MVLHTHGYASHYNCHALYYYPKAREHGVCGGFMTSIGKGSKTTKELFLMCELNK